MSIQINVLAIAIQHISNALDLTKNRNVFGSKMKMLEKNVRR